ncbi:carboxylate-amine ligase [Saccharopolyspora mangrovi]|uniref:Putative glutamate--cysteine ligase 2 n=1 Tax=Saccharopolyspora mangrovi TaxID=3082379 RepID=A0ABU6A6Z1_9PSEU|nr:glutamate--cysteine ligase [Saccharopolyspora sp. S2-29]MEB3367315.1 glutamate--cysteine ligase [Saccharopolyspora sp. S2-29]
MNTPAIEHSAPTIEHAPDPALTFGVEEEFLVVVPQTGAPEGRGPAVLAGVADGDPQLNVHPELLTAQTEATTGICSTLAQLSEQLRSGRDRMARAAQAEGLALITSGTPPLPGAPSPVSPGPRFALIADTYRAVITDYQACGCHVHVGVPDRETAVAVVNHLHRWLPSLLAMSANSPFHLGADTGYASWRMVQQSRFPGSGIPPRFASAADHDRQVARLVDCGVLVDEAMTFWLARPSPHLPTVELRVADAATNVGEAMLQAALSRALVRTAQRELDAGREAPKIDERLAQAAVWTAARHGLDGAGVDLVARHRVPAAELVHGMVRWAAPALEETRDLAAVRKLVAGLLHCGTGARRQRAAASRGGLLAALQVRPR